MDCLSAEMLIGHCHQFQSDVIVFDGVFPFVLGVHVPRLYFSGPQLPRLGA